MVIQKEQLASYSSSTAISHSCRKKEENKKQKVKELAERRRSGIKPKRLDRSVRLRKSSDSDIEVIYKCFTFIIIKKTIWNVRQFDWS